MNNPFFSVLVPVYNVSQYLDECVNSLLAQTFDNFEIIMLDDGSTDDSGNKCDEWQKKDNRISVIHRENKGLFTTRLDQLQAARGEYVVFVDSDDYISPKTLQFLYDTIMKNGCDVVTYGRNIVDMSGEVSAVRLGVYENGTMFDGDSRHILFKRMFQDNNLISIWSKCIKRTLLSDKVAELRMYNGVNFGEDRIFTAAIFADYNKLVYTDKPLYFYRWNSNGISSRPQVKYFPDVLTCRKAVKALVESCQCENKQKLIKAFWKREWYGALYMLKEYLRYDTDKQTYTEVYTKTVQSVKRYGNCNVLYRLLFLIFSPVCYKSVKFLVKNIWPL